LIERGNIEQLPVRTLAKGSWTFADGSSFNAIGIGISNLSILNTGASAIRDAVALVVTDGTGQYSNARGLGTVVGSISVPAGQDFLGKPGFEATQMTIHSFKINRGRDIRS